MAVSGDKTVVVQGRLDIRKLAQLNRYFLAVGCKPATVSELVRLAVDTGFFALLNAGKINTAESVTFQQAFDELRVYGRLHKGGQNENVLHNAMTEEVIAAQTIEMGKRGLDAKEVLNDPRLRGQAAQEAEVIWKVAQEGRRLTMSEWNSFSSDTKSRALAVNQKIVPEELLEKVEAFNQKEEDIKRNNRATVLQNREGSPEFIKQIDEEEAIIAPEDEEHFRMLEVEGARKDSLVMMALKEQRRLTALEWNTIAPQFRDEVDKSLRPKV